ncbi:MAG: HYR domain-containing protein [Saprospiraceae bacterium]|nr:HYR domain-containing protein [Saprospiraceae bacterium]
MQCNRRSEVGTNNEETQCGYTHSGTGWDASATDNCDTEVEVTYSSSGGVTPATGTSLDGAIFELGTTTITWTADDGINTITCSFDVTVSDDDAPVISCSVTEDQEVGTNNEETQCGYTHNGTGWDASATDNCDTEVEVTYSSSGGVTPATGTSLDGAIFELGTTTITWTADDGINIITCSFDVTVSDDDAPVISCSVTEDQEVGTNNEEMQCGYTHSGTGWDASATDNCDTEVEVTYSSSGGVTPATGTSLDGAEFALGESTITWTATDGTNLTDICSFTVTVSDDEAPEISCLVSGDQPVGTDSEACTYTHMDGSWDASATDNCTGSPTLAYTSSGAGVTPSSGSTLTGAEFALGETTITWTATDGAILTDICSFTVTVSDDEMPVVSCLVSGDQPVGTDSDACTYTHVDGSWDASATDNCTASPTLAYTSSGAGVTPSSGSTLAGAVFALGETTITWTATDGANLTDMCSFTVTVSDDEAPEITCLVNGDQPVGTDSDACTYTHADGSWDAAATDNCTASPTLAYSSSGSGVTPSSGSTLAGAVFALGETTITWTATDGANLTDICSFTVTVNDDEAPEITCLVNGDQPVGTDSDACTYTHADGSWDASATDNCTAGPTLAYTSSGAGVTPANGSTLAGAEFALGESTITWTATDGTNLTDICSFTVTVSDDEAPEISCLVSGDQPVGTDSEACTYTHMDGSWDASATDNCTGSPTLAYTSSGAGATPTSGSTLAGAVFALGETTITWTATDGANLTDICSFTVTVNDDEAPEITCLVNGDQPVGTDSDACTYTHADGSWDANATDNCTAGPTLAYTSSGAGVTPSSGTTLTGAIFELGTTTITWTATDGANLTEVCSFMVTVSDDDAPSLTCPPNQLIAKGPECTNEFPDLTGLITSGLVTDNCSVFGNLTITQSIPAGTIIGAATPPLTLTFTVTDEAGNSSICSITVTFSDQTAPNIVNCPVGPIVVMPDDGKCTQSATWIEPTATDNCSSTFTWSKTVLLEGAMTPLAVAPGFDFPVGIHTVAYIATDQAGNPSLPCIFNVEVQPNTTPMSVISGGGTVCDDTTLPDLTFTSVGTGPWEITYTDGTNNYMTTATNAVHSISAPAPSEPGTLSYDIISVESGAGCIGTFDGSATVTVTPLTFVTEQPIGATYCKDATATALSVSASGTGTISYEWFSNTTNSTIGGTSVGTGSSYTPSTAVVGTLYYYVVASSDVCDVATSAVAEVIITPLTEITVQPIGESYCKDATAAAMNVLATGTGTISYEWFSNTTNSTIAGTSVGTGSSYTPSTAVVGTKYYYVVASSDVCDVVTSDVAEVIVTPLTEITVQPIGSSYCKDATATAMSVLATGTGTISYEWFSNTTNSTIGGTSVGTGSSYTPSTAVVGTLYYYVVASSDVCDVATSAVAEVIVTPLTEITVQPGGASYCKEATAIAMSVLATGTGTISYEWFSNTTNSTIGGTSVGTGSSYIPSTTVVGTLYYYIVASSDVCDVATSDVAEVIVTPLTEITVQPIGAATAKMQPQQQ